MDKPALRESVHGGIGTCGALLTAPDAERMVEQLAVFPLEEYGSPKFLEQHDWVVQLNLQAHHNAAAHADEFVMEALVSRGMLDTLIHNLLAAEVWRERAWPLLRAHLAHRVDSTVSWSLLFHETALANLLEVALYHRSACESTSEDMLLELADWAYRKLSYLNSEAHVHAACMAKERSAKELLEQSPEEQLDTQAADVTWHAALCGLTVVRYLAEHVAALPLGVMARLVSSNDTIMALLPLVDRPPWVQTHKGQMLRFSEGRWQAVVPTDRLKLALPDAQAWLALYNLLLEPTCRAKYDPDEYRRKALQRLRRHMHEPLLDQLPCLKGMQRMLDEMAVGADTVARGTRLGSTAGGSGQGIVYRASVGRGSGSGARAQLILEQIPAAREALTRGRDWSALAAHLRDRWLGDGARQLARERAERMLRAFEFLCDAQQGPADGAERGAPIRSGSNACAGCAGSAVEPVRIECWRQVRAGMHERWCELSLCVDLDRGPEAVTVAGEGSTSVYGWRRRLIQVDAAATRPLPCNGKIVVRYNGRKARAQLQLPSVAVRTHNDTPPGLWLVVGLLATDGLALQLRLSRADKPAERDPVAGVWYAYHAIGGAVTTLAPDGGEGGGTAAAAAVTAAAASAADEQPAGDRPAGGGRTSKQAPSYGGTLS